MRLLAITDGSGAALESIQALNGIVPIDLHVLPRPIPNEFKRSEVIVLAFDRFPTRTLEKLFDWLRDQGVQRIPVVLCLAKADIARFSASIRQISANIVSTPVDPGALLDAVEASDRQFGPARRQKTTAPARAVQSLANTFGSLFNGNPTWSKEVLEQVSTAGAEMNAVIKTHGFESWVQAVGQHHSYTARHCINVAGIASQWSQTLQFTKADQEKFTQAALLHDIGKIVIPRAILDKPTQLTDEEREIINQHPAEGLEIVSDDLTVCDMVKDIIYSHHELLDGTGYPRGLSGSQISDVVRCMTIIDIYSALVDARAYKKSMSPLEAYKILSSMDGKIDMDLLGAFKDMLDEHVLAPKAAA
ncbi:MAG: HD domain-containing protein [Hyphomicrobiales bacterium]|jgi:putative nucleotidyltransferase with HDIG domain